LPKWGWCRRFGCAQAAVAEQLADTGVTHVKVLRRAENTLLRAAVAQL
jgi:hypothetical protein